jgi:hypothetical protein
MPKKLTILIIALAVLAGGGVLVWKKAPAWLATKLEVRPGRLTMQPMGADGGLPTSLGGLLSGQLSIVAHARVRNASWLDLKVRDVAWRAFLSGREVAQGTLPDVLQLPSDREVPVVLEARVSLVSLGLALADMLQVRSADISVEVDATAEVFGLSAQRTITLEGFDLRLDQSGVLALPELRQLDRPSPSPSEAAP